MTETTTVAGPPDQVRICEVALHRVRRGRSVRFSEVPKVTPPPVRRPARIARMLALASDIQSAIDRGDVRGQVEAAEHLGVTPPRICQLVALTVLAPDIQEQILHLEAVDGVEPHLTERMLRPLTRELSWGVQRKQWAALDPCQFPAATRT